jgi:hypothetical protein
VESEQKPSSEAVLGSIPAGLREPLLDTFGAIVKNFRERRWEPSELNGGKFSEVVYAILRGHVDGSFPSGPKKPSNMLDACRALEKEPSEFPRSVRIQIPRILIALYEIRNSRGVGHVGGDVDPNHMDAVAVLYMAKWVTAELVRLFHQLGPEEASAVVDALVEREIPLIWEVEGRKRVLDANLGRRDAVLLLLYGTPTAISDTQLATWIEHPKVGYFRRDVLRPAHQARLIEFDETTGLVHLSPLGAQEAERLLESAAD